MLRKDEGNRQSEAGRLMTGLHQKSVESSLTEISTGGHQLWSATERQQRENSFEKMGQDMLKPKK